MQFFLIVYRFACSPFVILFGSFESLVVFRLMLLILCLCCASCVLVLYLYCTLFETLTIEKCLQMH